MVLKGAPPPQGRPPAPPSPGPGTMGALVRCPCPPSVTPVIPFSLQSRAKGGRGPGALLSPKNLRVGVRAEDMAMKSRPLTRLARPWQSAPYPGRTDHWKENDLCARGVCDGGFAGGFSQTAGSLQQSRPSPWPRARHSANQGRGVGKPGPQIAVTLLLAELDC